MKLIFAGGFGFLIWMVGGCVPTDAHSQNQKNTPRHLQPADPNISGADAARARMRTDSELLADLRLPEYRVVEAAAREAGIRRLADARPLLELIIQSPWWDVPVNDPLDPKNHSLDYLTDGAGHPARRAAMIALGMIGDRRSTSVITMVLGMRKPSQESAIRALEMNPQHGGLDDVLKCIGSDVERVRLAALKAAPAWNDRRAAPELRAALKDPSYKVSHAAAWAMGRLGIALPFRY